MNQLQTNFDKSIQSKGGLLNIDEISEQSLPGIGLVESKLDSFRYLLKLDLSNSELKELNIDYYVDIVKNSSINAYAFRDKDDKMNFVGINYGLVLRLFDYFQQLLSASDVFPNIGEADKEIHLAQNIKTELTSILDNFKPKRYSPQCPVRRQFAIYLWIFCTDFVFHHELGHHLFGHVKYFKNAHSVNFVQEVGLFDDISFLDDNSILQALELDADDLGSFLTMYKFLNAYAMEPILRSYSDDPLKILLIIHGVIFHIFDELRLNKSLDKYQTHPHPTIRTLYVMGNLTQYYSQAKGEKIDPSRYSSDIFELETLFHRISRYSFTQPYKSVKVVKEMVRLTEVLKILKNEVLVNYTNKTHFEMPRLLY